MHFTFTFTTVVTRVHKMISVLYYQTVKHSVCLFFLQLNHRNTCSWVFLNLDDPCLLCFCSVTYALAFCTQSHVFSFHERKRPGVSYSSYTVSSWYWNCAFNCFNQIFFSFCRMIEESLQRHLLTSSEESRPKLVSFDWKGTIILFLWWWPWWCHPSVNLLSSIYFFSLS